MLLKTRFRIHDDRTALSNQRKDIQFPIRPPPRQCRTARKRPSRDHALTDLLVVDPYTSSSAPSPDGPSPVDVAHTASIGAEHQPLPIRRPSRGKIVGRDRASAANDCRARDRTPRRPS